jgi:uncharacterized protein YcbK (DUF882 family)
MGDLTDHFDTSEFACKCGCGYANVRMALVYKLEGMRADIQKPMVITSGCRCLEHNRAVGGKPGSAHVDGLAVDIACTHSYDRFKVVEAARAAGIERIGLMQGAIHVDISQTLPSPRMWLYPPKRNT